MTNVVIEIQSMPGKRISFAFKLPSFPMHGFLVKGQIFPKHSWRSPLCSVLQVLQICVGEVSRVNGAALQLELRVDKHTAYLTTPSIQNTKHFRTYGTKTEPPN